VKNDLPVYLSLRTASLMLGVSKEHARRLLQEPDVVEKHGNYTKFLFSPEHIELTKHILDERRCQRKSTLGKRSCYHCRKKFDPAELKSGLCVDCQAWKTVLNFTYSGDCLKCPADTHRLNCLEAAIKKMELKINALNR
jgi:hypothetical protein